MRLNVPFILILAIFLRWMLGPLAARPSRRIYFWHISAKISLLEAFILETLLEEIRVSSQYQFDYRNRGDLDSAAEWATRTVFSFYSTIIFMRRWNTQPELLSPFPSELLNMMVVALQTRSPEAVEEVRRRVEAER